MLSNKKRMKKKGIIDPFSLVVFVVVAGTISIATYFLAESEQTDFSNYYIGDIDTKEVYNFDCRDRVPESKMILFESWASVQELNFTYRGCS